MIDLSVISECNKKHHELLKKNQVKKSGLFVRSCICETLFVGYEDDRLCPNCKNGESVFNDILLQKIIDRTPLTDAEFKLAIEVHMRGDLDA